MFQSFLNYGTQLEVMSSRSTGCAQQSLNKGKWVFFFLKLLKKRIVPEVNMKLGIESL